MSIKVAAFGRTLGELDVGMCAVAQGVFGAIKPAVIRVYDEADNVIETHEHKGEFKDW